MIPNDFLEKSMNEVVLNHIEEIIYIVAVGIQNDIHEPKEDLKDFIRNNFTSNDLVKVLLIVFQSINVKDFLNSIVLIKGMNVLQDQTSLKKQEEIIAPVPGQ